MQITKKGLRPGETRDLGDGLRLRWSRTKDIPAVRNLAGQIFRSEEIPFNQSQSDWVGNLMSGEYPAMGPSDFALIEDTRPGQECLVATTCYWHHIWEYAGIPFRVGRPEFVATLPAYRNRGLVRALFAEIHARSQDEGDLIQVITGIPYFYRQFDYEYALDLDGVCRTPIDLILPLPEHFTEPYVLRDANEEDIPLLRELYAQETRKHLVRMTIPDEWWRYQLTHWQNSNTGDHWHIQLIIDQATRPWGYVVTYAQRRGKQLPVMAMAFAQDANLLAIVPSLLRALKAEGLRTRSVPLEGLTFPGGRQHPIYEVLGEALAPYREPPYAWYVRVPDLVRFLRLIGPALEDRLAHSFLAGYTGELKLDLYKSGLRLVFEQGKLLASEDWPRPAFPGSEDAKFPPLVFLQLLFGYRSLDEIRHNFPDASASASAALVLKTLFPVIHSPVLSL